MSPGVTRPPHRETGQTGTTHSPAYMPARAARDATESAAVFSYPRSVPSPCRFCGATDRKITNEHIWPEWLEDFVPPVSGRGLTERWSSASGHRKLTAWSSAAKKVMHLVARAAEGYRQRPDRS